ncbi:MAG TPA: MG2 domain-containing protein, partial [Phnomibacter sp.]|nr:MG2 domain-containing protein [Phnomibacter sp.]
MVDFAQAIQKHYQLSLQQPKLLQATPLSQWEAMIIPGNQRNLRPTLYDLLAHNALSYYQREDLELPRPAQAFALNDVANLSPAKMFLKYEYKTQDTLNQQYQAIKLYQQLIAWHLESGNTSALVDVDISRLQYASQHNSNPGAKQLYKEGLEHILVYYKQVPESAQAGYLLAQWWQQKGNNYVPGTGTAEDKDALKIAAQYAKQAFRNFPESEGGTNAANLLRSLQEQQVNLTVEKVNLPGEPFRALVSFKNIGQVQLKLIQVTPEIARQLKERNIYRYNYENTNFWNWLIGLTPARTWQQTLPAMDDLRTHSVEIKIDALPVGKYLLLAAPLAGSKILTNTQAAALLHVSTIAYTTSQNNYFILHRKTGLPLAAAQVKAFTSQYDYNTRQTAEQLHDRAIADKNGLAAIKKLPANNYRGLRLEFTYGTDSLYLDDTEQSYYRYDGDLPNRQQQPQPRYFFFTDRSLYRPGQTVFFKAVGVLSQRNGKGSTLYLPGKLVTVTLYDANGQEVSRQELLHNHFGSINGKFTIPTGLLAGQYSLRIQEQQEESSTYFRVEEYKRPKFYAQLKTPEKAYRIGDEIAITGEALAYAGNAIDGAAVTYRVYRSTFYPDVWRYWRYCRSWPPYGRQATTEITSGQTTTDAQGKFTITYPALPDETVRRQLMPAFNYVV